MNIVSYILIGIFTVLAVTHGYFAYVNVIRRDRHLSYVPFVVGCLGCLGFWLNPDAKISGLWWLPFLLDWGSIPMLLEVLVHQVKK